MLQIYDMKKYKIVQEYPISINDYVACLVEFPRAEQLEQQQQHVGRRRAPARKSRVNSAEHQNLRTMSRNQIGRH